MKKNTVILLSGAAIVYFLMKTKKNENAIGKGGGGSALNKQNLQNSAIISAQQTYNNILSLRTFNPGQTQKLLNNINQLIKDIRKI